MWALAYMFVVSLPHPHGSSAGSSEWWRQFRQYIAVHPLKARGAAWQVSILCSRSTAAQTGGESNGRCTRDTPKKSLSPTLFTLSPFPGPREKPPRETSQEPSERGQNRTPDGAREWPPASETQKIHAPRPSLQRFVRFRLPVPVGIDASARVDG